MISQSRDSTLCVVTRLWTGHRMNRGLIPSRSKRCYSSPQHPSTFGPHPACCLVGTGALFPQQSSSWAMRLATFLHMYKVISRMSGAILIYVTTCPRTT